MAYKTVCESLKNEYGVILIDLRICISEELPERARQMYSRAGECFAGAVKKRLILSARADYEACRDRRKRYRYPVLEAVFSAVCCDDQSVEVCITAGERILRHERHIWKNDTLLSIHPINPNK